MHHLTINFVHVIHHITYPSHPLLVMITSVSQDTYGLGFLITMNYTHFILRTHSGMVMDVTPIVPAAHSTILHISPIILTTLPLMILNYDCAVMNHHYYYEDIAVELVEIYVK